jgi:hypothetical protein
MVPATPLHRARFGGVSRAEGPNSSLLLSHSAEYYTNFITGAYQKYLGRQPEQAGLAFWRDLMQHHGLTDERLEAGFIGSQEYINNHGGTSRAWVLGMYQKLLGRTPAEAEVSYWLNQLAAGTKPQDLRMASPPVRSARASAWPRTTMTI